MNKYHKAIRQKAPPPRQQVCPQPVQENDEYLCRRCWIRWDTHEEKPPCQRKA